MNEVKYLARSLAEAVSMYACLRPDVCAVADKNGPYTYHELWDDICLCAETLTDLGVRKGSRIVMECTQDALFLAANLSCQLLGAVFVGVERRVAPGRLAEIVRQTEPVLAVTRKKHEREPVPGAARETAVSASSYLSVKEFETLFQDKKTDQEGHDDSAGLKRRHRGEESVHMIREDTLSEILFSTGTTGRSKGAMLTNRANVANAQNIIDGVHMEEDAVELVPLPINHAHGLRTCYAHLLNGSTVLITNGITFPRVLFDMIDRYGANAIDLTPSAAQMLMNTSAEKLKGISGQIRYVEVGAAFLPEGTKQMLRECFPTSRLYNCYGSSESGRTCNLEFGHGEDFPDCIGVPVPNARFAVLGPDGQPMKSDREHTGLLASAGPMNMSGYWREPELSAETIKDGYVVTADLAYIDECGCVYVFGRKDEVITYKGIKIAPEEIEEIALGSDLIADCALVPVEDDVAGQVPKLFVVPADPAAFRKEELFDYLKKHVDDNRMPRTIEQISEIPRTYNGKTRRKELASR